MSSSPRPRTTAAILTAAGRGAIGVVRVWGEDAMEVVDTVFRPNTPTSLRATPPGRPRVGRIGEGIGDEVVAYVALDSPGELEIQGHGGHAALRLILEALQDAGARVEDGEAWNRRHGQGVAAEAWSDLPHAPTARGASILLDQANGTLEAEIAAILDLMQRDRTAAVARLETLEQRAPVGIRLTTGWRVVLAGRPNVGKSSLLNALAGFERAIISPIPGTTRDLVTIGLAVRGWPILLSDTAGLREAANEIEALGVDLARQAQEDADLILLVLDLSEPLQAMDRMLLESLPGALRVATKEDLEPAWEAASLGAFPVSATQGAGLEELLLQIEARLVSEPPAEGAAVPFRESQLLAIREAKQRLTGGQVAEAVRILRALLSAAGPRTPGTVDS